MGSGTRARSRFLRLKLSPAQSLQPLPSLLRQSQLLLDLLRAKSRGGAPKPRPVGKAKFHEYLAKLVSLSLLRLSTPPGARSPCGRYTMPASAPPRAPLPPGLTPGALKAGGVEPEELLEPGGALPAAQLGLFGAACLESYVREHDRLRRLGGGREREEVGGRMEAAGMKRAGEFWEGAPRGEAAELPRAVGSRPRGGGEAALPAHSRASERDPRSGALRPDPEADLCPYLAPYNQLLSLACATGDEELSLSVISVLTFPPFRSPSPSVPLSNPARLQADFSSYLLALRCLCGSGEIGAALELLAHAERHAPDVYAETPAQDRGGALGPGELYLPVLEELERRGALFKKRSPDPDWAALPAAKAEAAEKLGRGERLDVDANPPVALAALLQHMASERGVPLTRNTVRAYVSSLAGLRLVGDLTRLLHEHPFDEIEGVVHKDEIGMCLGILACYRESVAAGAGEVTWDMCMSVRELLRSPRLALDFGETEKHEADHELMLISDGLRSVGETREFFDSIEAKDTKAINALLRALERDGTDASVEDAARVVDSLFAGAFPGCLPDKATLEVAIRMFATPSHWKRAASMLEYGRAARGLGVRCTTALCNSVLAACEAGAEGGGKDENIISNRPQNVAVRLLEDMKKAGGGELGPNVNSYMHVIGALVKAGEYEEALDFRGEMIEQLGAEWEWDVKRDVDRGLVRAMEGDERWEDEVEKIVRDNPSAFE
ncbi:hypothetical protein TeGR_g3749 [Tetraparma gracilis]|uniref:Pentatricopeptide repeat-containing protein n=1 Tax=Tetraparma gracilis TaxID=2962635 RepID=A0ABQ6M662_9STRA|nr:hypothetical protein TeGR_g3749 [Tetraparma gracilis]